MSNFPSDFDDDVSLPIVNDNLTEIGGEAINAVRDAVFNIEQYLGLGANGTTSSVATRLGISLNPDGTIKSSAIASLGLVTLPITNNQIANNAGIPESKLKLDHRTQDLFNYVSDMVTGVNTALGWIGSTGSKLDPHLLGFLYRHTLDQIDVTNDPNLYLKNKFRTFRNNTNSFTVLDDMNDELLAHQFADGSPTVPATLIVTNDGSTYPATHAHLSAGIYLNTSRFTTVPQTATDLQQFADFIDSSSLFLIGSRLQNLYSNGVSRASRSSSFTADGYGQSIVPVTRATAYLFNLGTSTAPFDDIDTGDDIIEFTPAAAEVSSNSFDAKFALVQVGDVVTINYGTVEVQFLIKEKKYFQSGGNKKYVVRINGRNLQYTTDGYARIDKPLFNLNKYGVLSLSAANNAFNQLPSLIVTNPASAMALGLNFNPDLFDTTHYNLYLALFPTGNPSDGYTILPAIDVTGNQGSTPGKYTLDSIVEATNNAFRQAGYNYRFVAFKYQGEFGIALADPYNNASFSILSGVVDSNGSYDSLETSIAFVRNVVGLFAAGAGLEPVDPLGFGPNGSNIASPPYQSQYVSPEQSQLPTKLFVPLKRNTYYVNGIERDRFALEPEQILDGYGDGYWIATVTNKVVYGNRVETTYNIPFDLDNSSLSIGKTIVVQSLGTSGLINYGRFIIKDLSMGCTVDGYTNLTVYDAVHADPPSPQTTLNVGSRVAVYFNSDSVGFNIESATDFTAVSPFKRHFEIYIDQNGKTFSQERGRIYVGNNPFVVVNSINLYTNIELAKLNIVKISPKLRGYQFATVNKITLKLSLNATNGSYNGYLASYDGVNYTKQGPLTVGYLGQVTRFYDETNVEYIDIKFDVNESFSTVTDVNIDFQLFPTLSLDQEVMLLGTCQVNDSSKVVNYLVDERQFGNTSEKDLTTSALNLIALGEKYLHLNGVLRGFDLEDKGVDPNPSDDQIYLTGGLALVNGKFIAVNDQTVVIPLVKEYGVPSNYYINWALCVNDKGEYQPIPLLDYDPILVTPSNPNRIFTAYNVVNGSTYNLEATTFSNLINNRKDLTLLYVVKSEVDVGPIVNLTVSDARRYVNDADSSLYLKYTPGMSQGNFKSLGSILNWLKYNNSFNSTVFLNGVNETVTQPTIIDCSTSVATLDGLNSSNATITFNQGCILGNNLTFKNLTLNFNEGLVLSNSSSSGNNIHFEKCNINIIFMSPPDNNICLDFIDASNMSFKDCIVNITFSSNANGGAAIRLSNCANFVIEESTFNCSFSFVPAPAGAPGDFLICKGSEKIKVINSIFIGNYKQFLRITDSSNILVDGSSIRTSHNPYLSSIAAVYNSATDPLSFADLLPNLTYNPADLVNTGRGLIYSYITNTLDNVTINNCTFTYAPGAGSTHRLSFINFQFANNNTTLSNLKVTSCTFRNNNASTVEDKKAAIAIINTATSGSATQVQPALKNVNISDNYCNKNQLICLTSKTDNLGNMNYAGLMAQNCYVSNNICGAIGYWVASAFKVDNVTSTNVYNDKEVNLIINGNNCHLVYNCDSTGLFFSTTVDSGGTTINTCQYPSGIVTIQNNSCNWIHVNISFEESSYLKIIDNYLSAYNVQYLSDYVSVPDNYVRWYAIYVNSNNINFPTSSSPPNGNDSSCIIMGNSTSTGYWVNNTLFTPVNYSYRAGYINSQASSIISNNILKGIGVTTTNSGDRVLLRLGGLTHTVTNNKIYRYSTDIDSYIKYENLNNPTWASNYPYGLIVDNILDSPYRYATDENVINNFPDQNWTIEKNKNQTGYATIPLTNGVIPFGIEFGNTFPPVPPYPQGYANFGSSGEYYVTTANSSVPFLRSYVLRVHDEEAGPLIRSFAVQQDICKYLPNNVQLINADLGVKVFGGSQVTPGMPTSQINLAVTKYVSPSINYTNLNTFTLVTTNDPNIVTTASGTITAAQFNTSANTIPISINLSSSYLYTGKNYALSVMFSYYLLRDGTDLDFLVSPVVIKYRW